MASGPSNSGRRARGRPKLPGKSKIIRLRDSVFQLWRDRKQQLGFDKVTELFRRSLAASMSGKREHKVSCFSSIRTACLFLGDA